MQRSTARPSPLRLGESSLSQKSRQSLPVARPATEHGPGSASTGAVQSASPEVISSLISSLSAISTPAQSHFENLPKIESRTAPSSPAVQQTEFVAEVDAQQQSGAGFGMDYGAYRSPAAAEDSEQDYLHPDAAAASPIVRMSKPPPSPRSPRSPRSPLSPRSRRSSRSLPDDKGPLRSGSRASLPSSITAAGQDDLGGMGAISVEGPAPRRSSASVTSVGSGSKRSVKSPFNLLKRQSRDFAKEKERDHLNGLGEPPRLNSSRSGVSLRSNHSMADLAEEGAGDTDIAQTTFTGSAGALNGSFRTPEDSSNFSPGGIGSGRTIPTRESSLRHAQKRGSLSNKRRSARHSAYSSHDMMIEDEKVPETTTEESGVSKRIGEIKDQQRKIRDELLQDDSASGTPPPKSLPQTPNGRKQQHVEQQATPPQSAPSSRQPGRPEPALREVDELRGQDDPEDSAPSPAVLTHKSLSNNNKRTYSPLMAKSANVPSSPSLDRSDSANQKNLKRQSDQSRTAESKNGRHRLSGTASPAAGRGTPGPGAAAEERPSSADSIDNAVEAYLTAPRLTQRVPHPESDRIIAFSEVGDPKGHVVFCCVGMGLTRYLTAFYDELARTLKLRLITPDRPGVGESEPCADGTGTPLSWPDDLAIICNHLKITKFSLLAHSAGAIYALATALRMPQHIRGRVHLLAPWIPPSQMSGIGSHKEPLPAHALPYSQRLLRALPTTFLRVANSSFMTATSSSITSSLPKNSRRAKRRSTVGARETPALANKEDSSAPTQTESSPGRKNRNSPARLSQTIVSRETSDPSNPKAESAVVAAAAKSKNNGNYNHNKGEQERNADYDNRLTYSIWELATTNANPAVDLLICLERRQPIGFRYVDINRSVVIHHGSRDTRVPVDNVRWLGGMMRRCEVRVLEGEGHGLMASATVMGNVLMEISKEWDDWTTLVQGRGRRATTTAPR